MPALKVDASKCSGCCRCQVNCSFFHSGQVGRARARVRVVKIEAQGIDYPVVCRQCRERYCLKCPESAIEIGPLGQVIVSATLCTGCGACVKSCPIGAIEFYEETPYVCDLCGGRPKCVEQCNLGAITYLPDRAERTSLEKYKKPSKGLTPEQKRVAYARDRTAELREAWVKGGRA